jgi:predicted secreted Zn-dependent protease
VRRTVLHTVLIPVAATAMTWGSLFGQGVEAAEWWAGIDTLPPGVTVLALDSLYPVAGATEARIRAELDLRGPVTDGQQFHGSSQTVWRYNYRLLRMGSGACRTQSFRLLVRNVFTLPYLVNEAQTPEDLRRAFQEYSGYLRAHEDGHHGIALAKLYEFRRDVEDSGYPSCEAARQAIAAMSQNLAASLRELQASYDEATDHGRTQGAVWPPRQHRRPDERARGTA